MPKGISVCVAKQDGESENSYFSATQISSFTVKGYEAAGEMQRPGNRQNTNNKENPP